MTEWKWQRLESLKQMCFQICVKLLNQFQVYFQVSFGYVRSHLGKTPTGLRSLKGLGIISMWSRFDMRTPNGSGILAI